MPYGITQCYLPPGRGDIPAFTPAKTVLDLATPEGFKAELTYTDNDASQTLLRHSLHLCNTCDVA